MLKCMPTGAGLVILSILTPALPRRSISSASAAGSWIVHIRHSDVQFTVAGTTDFGKPTGP
jgi:hypothetical protein